MNYERSESISELTKALSAAQAVMGSAAKDKLNPHFNSRYADLASCLDACRKPLADNGLAIFQPSSSVGSSITVTTLLAHTSGEWISSDLTITAEKATAQGLGSALSYARRYSLSSMIGLGAEDDDGAAASGTSKASGADKEPRGSRKAQEEVVERKLGKSPEPQAISTGKAPTPDQLKKISDLTVDLGEVLYLRVLGKHGFKSASEIQDIDKAKAVFNDLSLMRKLTQAAVHGEILPGVDEQIFLALPETSRAAVLNEMKAKLCAALGSQDSGREEFELTRRECKGNQYHFYLALEKSHEAFSKQGVA